MNHPNQQQVQLFTSIPKNLFLAFLVLLGSPALLYAQEKKHKTIQYKKEDTAFINSLLKEASQFTFRNQTDSARDLALYQQALTASRRVNYPYGIAHALTGMAQVAMVSDYQQAFTLLREAEQIYDASETDLRLQAFTANTKAICFSEIGFHDSAIVYYLKAIDFYKKSGQKVSVAYYNNIATLLQETGNYKKAEYYFDEAIKNIEDDKDSVVMAGILINKAKVYFINPNEISLEKAIELTQQGLAITRRHQAKIIEARALINLANLMSYQSNSDTPRILSYLKQAKAITGLNITAQIHICNSLAYYYYDLKQFASGDEQAEKALALANAMPSPKLLTSVYSTFEYGQRARGNYKKAYHYADLKKVINDSLENKNTSLKANYLQFQFETAQKDNELIKKELLISQQEVKLQRRMTVIISLFGGTFTLGGLAFLYFRNRRKTEHQRMKYMTWEAAVEGEEKERARLAHELHDNIGGSLSTVKMWFGTIQKQGDNDAQREKDFEEAMQLLDQTLTDLRDTAHHLMPEFLLRYGLAKAVRIYCENIQKAGELVVEYHYFGFIGILEKKLDLLIYRIIQELLQNVIKHANASFVLVQLSRHDDTLSVTVEDNGMGMTEADESKGMGLQNIKMSVGNLKGHFNLHSEKGHGTTVYFEINVAK